MTIDLNKTLNSHHKRFFKTTSDEVVFYGGAGAGKSYSVCDKLALYVIDNDMRQGKPVKIVVVRKSMPSLKRTCEDLIDKRFKALGVPYEVNKLDMVAKVGNDSKIVYVSIDHEKEIEKVKSITDTDIIWIEEANEVSENVYEELIRRLRGGKGSFKQIILTFNPISVTSWIYDRFFVRNIGNALKIKTNCEENDYIEESYKEKMRSLKFHNENLYNVYYLGEWGQLQETIYQNYDVVDSIPGGNVFYGLDFGYNNPSALVKVTDHDGEYYIEQKIYKTKLTNNDLIEYLKTQADMDNPIYCDSAEPARIEELSNAGFNVYPAIKKVNDGINHVMGLSLHIDSNSEDLIKEMQSYSYRKDKDGKVTDEPVKYNDHLLDAMRYALYTETKDSVNYDNLDAFTVGTEFKI